MKLSELILAAAEAMKEHGDIPVVADDSGCGCCGTGTGFAGAGIETDVWVYDHSSEHGSIPVVFKVEG
ncbi:hypothetical protein [Streptomyces sp. WG5]|uniref:hypothetical protein n=1 Tax=Streptomyces sp. WG5 TaxID=3417648 RepID=UPI003CEE892D